MSRLKANTGMKEHGSGPVTLSTRTHNDLHDIYTHDDNPRQYREHRGV